MASNDNQSGTTILPGGVDIIVPDLTVARAVGTVVYFQSQIYQSLDAATASYAPLGGVSVGAVNNIATAGVYGGSYDLTLGAGAGLPVGIGDPVAPGLFLHINTIVDGGGTQEFQTGAGDPVFNKAGNNKITFGALNDFAIFRSATRSVPSVAGNFRWILVANDGAVLGTI